MNRESTHKKSQNIEAHNTRNNGQIGQAGRDLTQNRIKIVIRFFRLLSEQALKGSIFGVVVGLSLIFISHNIFFPIAHDYTKSSSYSEFICAIFVGLYCYLFCGNHISRKSRKIFLAALAFVITWLVLPSVRQVFLPGLEAIFNGDRNTADTISYSISYAIICVLAGGVIETIAEIIHKKQSN